MPFNYTNSLRNAAAANNGDFVFYDRAGATGPVAVANTAGEWCEEVSSTASGGTGPSTTPPGETGFIYTETSSPAASTVWKMRRATTFDATQLNRRKVGRKM